MSGVSLPESSTRGSWHKGQTVYVSGLLCLHVSEKQSETHGSWRECIDGETDKSRGFRLAGFRGSIRLWGHSLSLPLIWGLSGGLVSSLVLMEPGSPAAPDLQPAPHQPPAPPASFPMAAPGVLAVPVTRLPWVSPHPQIRAAVFPRVSEVSSLQPPLLHGWVLKVLI